MLNCYYAHADTEEGQQVSVHLPSHTSSLTEPVQYITHHMPSHIAQAAAC